MTNISRYIAGDWGTSNLRLYLCEHDSSGKSQIADTIFGPGISRINNNFEDTFFELAQPWLEQWGAVPVLLSGMVGSTIGWRDAPYLTCPVKAEQIATGRIEFEARGVTISILAGLRTKNPLGSIDVMRGEELQMLGWLHLQEKDHGRNLFVLPGTHNKWALVENGLIANFLTAFTGELFSLLRDHSILITEKEATSFKKNAFIDGVRTIAGLGEAQLVHALFSTRSKQVLDELASDDAASYLSGLIVGADVMGAHKLFGDFDNVTIIGEPTLSQCYTLTLNHFGIASQNFNSSEIAASGFDAIYQHLHEQHR